MLRSVFFLCALEEDPVLFKRWMQKFLRTRTSDEVYNILHGYLWDEVEAESGYACVNGVLVERHVSKRNGRYRIYVILQRI